MLTNLGWSPLADRRNEHRLILNAVGTILRNGTERNGTERNDGLNYGTERFLKLKLATYHC